MSSARRLFFLMTRAHRAAVAGVNARARETLDISLAQLTTVYYVARHPGCSMTEIANLLDLNKSAVSSMVQRLETSGYVKREANPKDGRGSLLTMTPKGEAVRVQSLPLIRKLTAEITDGFSEAEVDTVVRFFDAIIARFADEDAVPDE